MACWLDIPSIYEVSLGSDIVLRHYTSDVEVGYEWLRRFEGLVRRVVYMVI